jgi:hypothetical protein
MTSSGMDKTKSKKQLDKDTIAEVTLEMAKPRVAMSARRDTNGTRNPSAARDPMELLWEKVAEGLAAPSQGSTGMSLTPNVNTCLKTLGVKATLIA